MKPFLSGRPAASQPPLQALSSPTLPEAGGARVLGHSHGSAKRDAASGPNIECVKQGDKVVRLIVTCSCGERIEIECLYPSGG